MGRRQQAARLNRTGTVSRAFVHVFGTAIFLKSGTAELNSVKYDGRQICCEHSMREFTTDGTEAEG